METKTKYANQKLSLAEKILRSYKLIQIQAKSDKEARKEEAETRITSQLKDIVVQTSGISDKVGDAACRLATKSRSERKLEIIDNFISSMDDEDKEIMKRHIINREKIIDLSCDYQLGISGRTLLRKKKEILTSFCQIIFVGEELNKIFS